MAQFIIETRSLAQDTMHKTSQKTLFFFRVFALGLNLIPFGLMVNARYGTGLENLTTSTSWIHFLKILLGPFKKLTVCNLLLQILYFMIAIAFTPRTVTINPKDPNHKSTCVKLDRSHF